MPKFKVPRKSTFVDMTAMVDVAFLLVTFFMLATKMAPAAQVKVTTPTSQVPVKVPETDIVTLLVTEDGRVFFDMDNKNHRQTLLSLMGQKYGIGFSEKEAKDFGLAGPVGVPMEQMQAYLAKKPQERAKLTLPGVPADTTASGELGVWINNARAANPNVRILIKADGEAAYPKVEEVMKVLQAQGINKFNLITNLEGN